MLTFQNIRQIIFWDRPKFFIIFLKVWHLYNIHHVYI